MHLSEPVSRLRLVQQEVDAAFGANYAALQAATTDWAAERLAFERVAVALMVEGPAGTGASAIPGPPERLSPPRIWAPMRPASADLGRPTGRSAPAGFLSARAIRDKIWTFQTTAAANC